MLKETTLTQERLHITRHMLL